MMKKSQDVNTRPWDVVTGLPDNIIVLQTWNPPLGVSGDSDTYGGFNLALHVGDQPEAVQVNRIQLLEGLAATAGIDRVYWVNQVHGTAILDISDPPSAAATGQNSFDAPTADALISEQPAAAIAVLTADCLPVLLYDSQGRNIAVVHAGWRGLLAGIIQQTALRMKVRPDRAFLGAAIGPQCFEVGAEVRDAFVAALPAARDCFMPLSRLPPGSTLHYLGDLYALARLALAQAGIDQTSGGQACTLSTRMTAGPSTPELLPPFRYYSYRRQPVTGRQALVAMIRPEEPE